MAAVERMTTVDRDPFSNTADPDAYIPRTATESALVRLEMALRDGARVVCLSGPAGSGKTLLLNVLEERLAGDFCTLRVPYPKLDPDEFCRWGLAALREPAAGDPERALAARIVRGAASGDPPLVWVIDDADYLPVPTLRSLLWLQRTVGDALRLLLARSGELPGGELAEAGVLPVNVELDGEMESAEMTRYVRARLDRSGVAPGLRARIEAAIGQLYARSHGNPGRLHAAAATLLCFGPDRLDALALEEEFASVRAESDAIPGNAEIAEIAVSAPARPDEIATPEAIDAGRVSIESLVAEAVAAEQPAEEIAILEPTTVLVAKPVPEEPAPEPAAAAPEPERVPDTITAESPATDPSPGRPPHPAPRKRHRLRRLGRR